jgi:hypothetical protein
MIGDRIGETASANGAALRLADFEIGLIRLWITGETPSSSRALAETIIRATAALHQALRTDDAAP